ncbi:uncharacterized protein F4822DRAFT_433712 [Hypoxylon trugodes]|uniref:uncharacterized protein n=1 Tax=Hypoxylon trugodes TaxID=326681 RepID=UPI002196749E|nr:uncharacterized protein F4822DRAFT_433712 [Hypoxylon trugodes]KAI1383772.1 hypothetical protein F4822DRAFT_433712 [Hypoxylon trugodes]
MTSQGSTGVHLTARDVEILSLAWQCFDTNPKINWQKLADVAGFKNASTACACFGPIRKKLGISGTKAGAEDDDKSNHTPSKSATKRKVATPKTPHSSKKAKSSRKALTSDEEDDDEVKPKVEVKTEVATPENEKDSLSLDTGDEDEA